MSKKEKFKEPPKVKVLNDPTKDELGLIYSAVTAPEQGKGASIEDWKLKESLYNTITDAGEKNENGVYEFEDQPVLYLKLPDYDLLIKDLKKPIFMGIEGARAASELLDRLANCETEELKPDLLAATQE